MKQLRYFALIPALLLVIGAGCGKAATNTNTVAVVNDAVANENENATNDGEIDTSDWNKFSIPEIGYSVLLPFSEDNIIDIRYTDCDSSSASCGTGDKGQNFYINAYYDNGEYAYGLLGAISEEYARSRGGLWFEQVIDFEVNDGAVVTKGIMSFSAKFIEYYVTEDLAEVVIIDSLDVPYYQDLNAATGITNEYHLALLKTENIEKFKIISFSLPKDDYTVEQLKKVVNSFDLIQ